LSGNTQGNVTHQLAVADGKVERFLLGMIRAYMPCAGKRVFFGIRVGVGQHHHLVCFASDLPFCKCEGTGVAALPVVLWLICTTYWGAAASLANLYSSCLS
jgi:hypothetical protein